MVISAARKDIETQIIASRIIYNHGDQKSISACTKHLNLKMDGYNRRSLYWVPLLSAVVANLDQNLIVHYEMLLLPQLNGEKKKRMLI